MMLGLSLARAALAKQAAMSMAPTIKLRVIFFWTNAMSFHVAGSFFGILPKLSALGQGMKILSITVETSIVISKIYPYS